VFGGFIQSQERKIVAGQAEELAKELQTGTFKAMNPNIEKYAEGVVWAGVLGALPILTAAVDSGTFSKATWSHAGAAFLVGFAAYLRSNNPTTPPK
jgi:hypothetical protein